jgi:hypothetical protein
MDMPMVQFRRFREAAALIPPAGGGSYRLDLYAAEAAEAAEAAFRVKTWLKCLRLVHLEAKLTSIGIVELRDVREVPPPSLARERERERGREGERERGREGGRERE